MGDQGYKDAVIQGRGASTNGDEYKSFQVRTKALNGDKARRRSPVELGDKLQTKAPGATTVSSSFGRQIASRRSSRSSRSPDRPYIAIRFDLKFAGPVIVAMLHDVLI